MTVDAFPGAIADDQYRELLSASLPGLLAALSLFQVSIFSLPLVPGARSLEIQCELEEPERVTVWIAKTGLDGTCTRRGRRRLFRDDA